MLQDRRIEDVQGFFGAEPWCRRRGKRQRENEIKEKKKKFRRLYARTKIFIADKKSWKEAQFSCYRDSKRKKRGNVEIRREALTEGLVKIERERKRERGEGEGRKIWHVSRHAEVWFNGTGAPFLSGESIYRLVIYARVVDTPRRADSLRQHATLSIASHARLSE